MKYQIVKYEQINEYGEQTRAILEQMDDYDYAISVLKEYIANNENYFINYDIEKVNN